MKILLPYDVHGKLSNIDGDIDINSKIVVGGVEKFCQDLYNNLDGIIPIHITKEDKRRRRTKKIMTKAIFDNRPLGQRQHSAPL